MPEGTLLIRPEVPSALMRATTAAGELSPSRAIRYSASPVMWGVAIEVPEIVLEALVPPIQAEVMLVPGARMSTTEPKLEYEAKPSVLVVAPTVMALAAEAGELCEM